MYLSKQADIKEIDAVLKYKVGLPMGQFELMDFGGSVEIRTKGFRSLESILKIYPEFEPWPEYLAAFGHLVAELWGPMTDKGLRGVKTGKGFYTYPGGYAKPEIPRELAENIEPIQLLAPAINTSAWCVSNGVGDIDDINKSFRFAYGWPKGIFEFVDEFGADNIAGVLKEKAEKASGQVRDFYKVDPLLVNWKS